MIIKTNLTDFSKITHENYTTYNEHVEYEVPRQWGARQKYVRKSKKKSEEEKRKHEKEYQHKYYIEVTKKKRRLKRKGDKNEIHD